MTQREKTGGRTKGTPNKVTYKIRSHLLSVLSGEIDKIPQYMAELEDKDKLAFLVKLLPYLIPRSGPISSIVPDYIESEEDADGVITCDPDSIF